MAAAEDTVKEEEKTTEVAAAAAPERPIPHMLNTAWTMYVDCSSGNVGDDWSSRLRKIATFNTVEGWWWLYKSTPKPSMLSAGSNVSVFRGDVKPLLEEDVNKNGGEYHVRGFADDSFDAIWLYSVLFCIGETSLKDNKLVVGTVASVRRVTPKSPQKFTVSMWINTTEKKDEKAVKRLGKFYKEQIGLGARKMRLPFKPHDKSEVAVHKLFSCKCIAVFGSYGKVVFLITSEKRNSLNILEIHSQSSGF